MQDRPAYNRLGYMQDCHVNSEKHQNAFAVTMPLNKFGGIIRCLSMPPDRNDDNELKMKTIMHQNLGMRAQLKTIAIWLTFC